MSIAREMTEGEIQRRNEIPNAFFWATRKIMKGLG